jgi:Flp pilus assembly protein TadG
MKSTRKTHRRRGQIQPRQRRGAVLVLAACVLVIIFAMTAFAVDLGYLSMTKTQLQSSADSAALAAALELAPGLGVAPTLTTGQVVSAGNAAAETLAGLHRNGDQSSTYVNTSRDVRYGQCTWNAASGKWIKTYGVAPYNLVEVTLRRDQGSSNAGDGNVPLLFGKTLGVDDAALNQSAAAALFPGVGVRIQAGSNNTAGVLPIALDLVTWEALMAGGGVDEFSYNKSTGAITAGPDGVREVDLYPYGHHSLPPGNRGTVDLGSPNNSTTDIKRQILHGLNAYDLSFFNGSLTTDNGPIQVNGDTGISAGIKAELEAIKGQPRLIPIFSAVVSPGNNAMYTIVKFVPIRIMHVKLTGNPKRVIVQPAPYSSSTVVPGHVSITADSYFSSPRLVE